MQSLPKFHGVAPALVTPMNEDRSINWVGLTKLIQHVSNGGVDYLVVQGTTGESATTTSDEKKQIVSTIQEANTKNLPIVYGLGGNNTDSLINQIKQTSFEGIDAILSVCPYYNKPSARGVIAHYEAVADACPVPVIMYNIPGRTGINMSAETVLKLSEHQNIIGIKEASCIIEQCMEIVYHKSDDFLLISGDDVQAVPIISIGGVGVMSVIANAFPQQFTTMIHHALAGDYRSAQKELGKFLTIDPYLYEEGNPVGVKKLLENQGLFGAQVRLPLASASAELGKKLAQISAQEGLNK
ncbi:4-hydroxy-tetrahydrodipicolinate synthase [Aquirufa antheringensis]|uniref:4-hydroxy-tetrahydrodipicolinate synthase n=1 Tax=Aquirufa antheringensis TaxID=2516559 RepID=UPI00208F58D1|nr:4-hydroxy-tetrahydrodipicolinate synthase [Aquirufa antheringensis]MCZ2485972.1 4-hydroxy-tetrahydrodipicolinate synthase [Aquirufa antheringensis]MCZ2488882.1 4-hydroxy-tetrahydrodipicolinate synthase [Aquirufa antheringensis]USQ04465.1 4-hydroxy-tetrahydrodipicolinate synthase [Aquirufa antheringensis]